MIYAHLENAENYYGLGDAFKWVISQLSSPDFASRPAGKTVYIPGKVWLSIDEPQTRPAEQVPFEAHREFIDVQMTICGEEIIGCTPLRTVVPVGDYSVEDDIQFFSGEGNFFDCRSGMFAVFFPDDAHRPGVAPGSPQRIRKVVAKIHRSMIAR